MKKKNPLEVLFVLITFFICLYGVSIIAQNVNNLPSTDSNPGGVAGNYVDHFTGTNNINIPI